MRFAFEKINRYTGGAFGTGGEGGGGGGSGTVTSVGVTTANGISGTTSNPNTDPRISLTLGNVTPSSVTVTPTDDRQAGVFRRNSSGQTSHIIDVQTEANGALGYVDKDGNIVMNNLTGTNTGDQVADGVTITGAGTVGDPFTAVGGSGTVTSVSVVTANGFSGSVANATSTPAITIVAGAIAPTSVNSVVISGSSTPTLAVTGTTTVSGTNTGDQTLSGLGGVAANAAISGATKTKITYDSKGLVTSGADATTADIADSTGRRYQTENQNTFNDFTSSGQTQLNSKFTNGGDSFAGTATIGTNDANILNLETNNTTRISIASTGAVTFNSAYTLPTAQGTDGQVLTADGAGGTAWETPSGGGGSPTLADIATNSTTTAHQTFALNASTDLIFEDSSGTDILKITESTGAINLPLQTASTIAILDASKNLISASTGTYPSLTEIAYVKGVTSALQPQLKKRNLRPTCELSNTSNTVLTLTPGTPLYYRYEVTSDVTIGGYEFLVSGYTSSGVLEIGVYSGADTGDLTLVTDSVGSVTVSSSGFKTITLDTPINLDDSQFIYYIAMLEQNGGGTFGVITCQNARNNVSIFSTGATAASTLPSTESTRNSTNLCPFIQPLGV